MPAYVDTSALVKRYVAEVGSAWVRRLLAHPAQYVIYTSALSQVEVISALQRRVREGSLAEAQAQRLAHRVTVHFAQRYQVVALTQAIVDQACVGLQSHPLRAADAVHLACALTIRRITQEQGLPPPKGSSWTIRCSTPEPRMERAGCCCPGAGRGRCFHCGDYVTRWPKARSHRERGRPCHSREKD